MGAAVKADGSVVSWGATKDVGDFTAMPLHLTGIRSIASNELAFAAVKADGSVVTWGAADAGGDSTAVREHLTDIKAIASTEKAFAAIKSDGSVVTWGVAGAGGDSTAVREQLCGKRRNLWGPIGPMARRIICVALLACSRSIFTVWGARCQSCS